MKKLKLLVLEDNDEDATELVTLLSQNDYDVTLTKNTIEAQKAIATKPFDIIILDIMINGKPEGIDFAKTLHQKNIDVPFIFLTSIQSKAIFEKAKYTNPFNYILKPYNALEVLYALELAIEKHYEQNHTVTQDNDKAVLTPNFLFVKKKNHIKKLDVADINYVNVEEKYCCFVTEDGNYLVKISLKKLKSQLQHHYFRQVHRNYLVNVKKIKEIYMEDNLIVLHTNDKIPFSSGYKTAFIKDNIFLK